MELATFLCRHCKLI